MAPRVEDAIVSFGASLLAGLPLVFAQLSTETTSGLIDAVVTGGTLAAAFLVVVFQLARKDAAHAAERKADREAEQTERKADREAHLSAIRDLASSVKEVSREVARANEGITGLKARDDK